MFDINHDDIRAVYGHLELPQCEVDKIIRWAERHQWTDMEQYLGWFGKTVEDEPAEEPPPVADCPVESIMDQIDRLTPKQLDEFLLRIHADYGVEHETSTSMIIDHPAGSPYHNMG